MDQALQVLFVRNKEMEYDNTQGTEKLHIFTNQTEWGRRSFAARGGMGVGSPA